MEVIRDILSWIKSVFTKDNVKRFIHEAELSVVVTASTTVNGFVNDPANQAAALLRTLVQLVYAVVRMP